MAEPRENPQRRVGVAIARGFRGHCPHCGKGRLLTGYIAPVPRCSVCGEDLQPFQTADFAPYLVVFVIGLLFTPLTIILSLQRSTPEGAIYVLVAIAVLTALALLPRAKGAAIGLLWALDVRSNQ